MKQRILTLLGLIGTLALILLSSKKEAPSDPSPENSERRHPRSSQAQASTATAATPTLINPPNLLHFPESPDPALQTARLQLLDRLKSEEAARENRIAQYLAAIGEEGQKNLPCDLELADVIDGYPRFIDNHNADAAISTNAHLLATPAYGNLTGAGITIGVWEAQVGNPSSLIPSAAAPYLARGHDEWTDRFTATPDEPLALGSNHAWSVIGTLIGNGINPDARGMAPGASVVLRSAKNVFAELASVAASSSSGVANGDIPLSNHSYGYVAGWHRERSGQRRRFWLGAQFSSEDAAFGRYDQRSADTDELLRLSPWHLSIRAAGNERNDSPPPAGTNFGRPGLTLLAHDPDSNEPIINFNFTFKNYNPDFDPPADAAAHQGFDTISDGPSMSKNSLLVGSVTDALLSSPVVGKRRIPGFARASSFSSWGPTDDGRIKPDIVANGDHVLTTAFAEGFEERPDGTFVRVPVSNQYNFIDGTSFSSPNACGTAALIIQAYQNHLNGLSPRADLLKALIIHTADDLGTPGPDGSFGWGLMNGAAAVDVINAHSDNPLHNVLYTSSTNGSNTQTWTAAWNETDPIRVTLCYADLPGTPKAALNDRSRALVNDLDVTITDPLGNIWRTFNLDPLHPLSPATLGDNDVDNVEQIFIPNPIPGTYTITLSTEGPISGGPQPYALIRTGLSPQTPTVVPVTVTTSQSHLATFQSTLPLAIDGWSYQKTNQGRATVADSLLSLDSAAGPSLSTATIHANLSTFTAGDHPTLQVAWRDANDTFTPLPALHNGLANGDGISISTDGTAWHRIADFNSSLPRTTLQSISINLDDTMTSLGLTYGPNVRIRFSQYGDQAVPDSGIQLESVSLFNRSPGRFNMAYAQIEEDESTGSANIKIDRIEGTEGAATISYFTRNLTAIAGTDYFQKSGTLNFAAGQNSATFTVDFKSNPAAHGPRAFEVLLTSPTSGTTLGPRRRSTVIIADDNESSTLRTDPATLRPTLVHGSSSHRQTLRAWNLNGFGRRQMEVTSNTPWITIEQLRQGDAITPALITLNYDLTQLPKGRHLGSVTVHQITAPASSREVPIVLTLGYPGEAIMATANNAPADLPVDGPVPLQGSASRYPLTLPAAASPYRVGAVFLGFDGLTHTNPADLDIVLASPDGKSSLIVSDAARSDTGSPITFGSLLGDPFLQSIPHLASAGADGPRLPINYEGFDPDLMPAPAPQTPGRLLSDLAGGSTAGTWKIFINDDAEANGGSVASAWLEIQTVDLSDGLYENPGDFDLGGQSILFTPEDSALGYLAGRSSVGGLPSITPGPIVSPNKDGYTTVSLTGGKSVPFYGITYTTLGIGENGDIVFGAPPNSSGELSSANFLSLPRLAALFGNLSYQASGSSIHYQQLDDRIRVVWAKLIDDKTGSQVSFSAEVFFDGRIRLTWDPTDDTTAFVGLSRGYGSEEFALPSDFSTLTEPPLEIRSYQFTPGGECTIAWSSIPDLTYILEWSPNLLNWNPITSTPGDPGEATFKTFTDPGDGTRLFLRVRKPNDL